MLLLSYCYIVVLLLLLRAKRVTLLWAGPSPPHQAFVKNASPVHRQLIFIVRSCMHHRPADVPLKEGRYHTRYRMSECIQRRGGQDMCTVFFGGVNRTQRTPWEQWWEGVHNSQYSIRLETLSRTTVRMKRARRPLLSTRRLPYYRGFWSVLLFEWSHIL